jgi:hypothetical protein
MIPPVKLGLLALRLAGWPLELEGDTAGYIPRLLLSTLAERYDVMKTLTSRSIIGLRRCSNALHWYRLPQEFLLPDDHE